MDTGDTYPLKQLSIRTRGAKGSPGVILLHGWASNKDAMSPVQDRLSDAYYTVNVDLPGHGESPPPPEPWGLSEHAHLITRLIERQRLADVTIVGHSNGGRIALYMASHPEYKQPLTRLALISPSGITPKRSWKYYLRRALAIGMKAPFQLLPKRLREHGLNWLRRTPAWQSLGSSDYQQAEGVMRDTFVQLVTHHLDEEVCNIGIPTLIFWGTKDTAIRRQQVDTLITRIPDAGLVELPGAGHYGHLDDLPTVANAIRYFLKNTGTPSP